MTIKLKPDRKTRAVFFNLLSAHDSMQADVDDLNVELSGHPVNGPAAHLGEYFRERPTRLLNISFNCSDNETLLDTVVEVRRSLGGRWNRLLLSDFFRTNDFQTNRVQLPVSEMLDGYTYLALYFPPSSGKVRVTFALQGDQVWQTMSAIGAWVFRMTEEYRKLSAFEPDEMLEALRQLGKENGRIDLTCPTVADALRSVTYVVANRF